MEFTKVETLPDKFAKGGKWKLPDKFGGKWKLCLISLP